MSLKKDASGRRYVQAEVEVPGTPEEVWQAIATGQGISSWFVPTEVRDDGTVVANFGPGMDAVSKVTAWDPPHRFAADSPVLGPHAPPIATEWIVEAQSGGVCIVRVVHSLFASTDDWDDQLESVEHGWPAFFRILRLYLTYFRGQPSSAFQLLGVAPEPTTSKAWNALTDALGLSSPTVGQRVNTAAGAPRAAGLVERVGPPEHPELLIRLEEPAPGLAHLLAVAMGGQIYRSIRIYLYGDVAPAVVAREEPAWQAWINEQSSAA